VQPVIDKIITNYLEQLKASKPILIERSIDYADSRVIDKNSPYFRESIE
jgi:hypothetical protein